jgi:N-acetylmuramoyl-L-alanine amidase
MPETWMARHCIGLNRVAIGIENVGDGAKYPLTDRQVEANASLVRYLAGKYSIAYLLGHNEYRRMEKTPLFWNLSRVTGPESPILATSSCGACARSFPISI